MSASAFDPGFTTEAMTRLWSNHARVEGMVGVEAALAKAQAACGVMTRATADEIARVCDDLTLDADAVLAEGWEVGTPVVVIVDLLRRDLDADTAAAVHLGATTQDIVDTATVLQIHSSLSVFEHDLLAMGDALARLADKHRATWMIGRTFGQHALPTTFGLRAAQWLVAVSADLAEMRRVRSTLPVQLGGPVGTGAGLGPDPLAVLEAFAEELSLQVPTLPWHTDRKPIRRSANAVSGLAETSAKVAADLIALSQTEIGEVSIRPGGSSAIAGKRNPIDAVRAVAAAQVCSAMASSARPQLLDRAAGPWHAEWMALPVVFQTAGAALEAVGRAVASLQVDTEAMGRRAGGATDDSTLRSTAVFVDRAITAWKASRG